MARIAFLAKNPKRTLGALAVMVAATGLVVGSGANFTASSANPNNSFAAGTLSILNDKENAAIFTTPATNLKPGGASVTGVVDIQNDGTLPGNFELSRSAPVDSDATNPLSGKLNLVIKDCGEWPAPATPEPCGDGDDTTIYGATTATIAGMSSPISLGNFTAGEKHRYEFTVQLDSSATDAYQDGESTVQFNWNAVQS